MPHAKRIAARPIDAHVQAALQEAGADPLLARLYAARGVSGADELSDSLGSLIPYTELTNCTAAALPMPLPHANAFWLLRITMQTAQPRAALP